MARGSVPASRKNKSTVVTVDFKGVKSGGAVPAGEYAASVEEVKQEQGDKAPYFAWEFKINGGKFDGRSLYHNTSLAPQALWNLRGVLEALGVEVPDGPLEINLKELVGLECVIVTDIDDSYDGKARTKIVDVLPADGGEGGGGEEGETTEEEAVTFSEDDIEGMDEKELAALIKEHELGVDPKKHKRLSALKNAVIEALEEAGMLGDGGGDAGEGDASQTYTVEAIQEMDASSLEELVKEHELDVDLTDFATLRRKRQAVIDALDGAGMIEK